jgi:hypothetical protein
MKTIKSTFTAQVLGYITGINKHYAGQTLLLNGQSVTAAQLVTLFQSVADAETAAKQADTSRTAAVAKATTAMQQAQPMAKAFKATVLAAFGADPTTLADFELTPPKVREISPATKAAAAQKAAATRKALGTKGSKQKAEAKKALATASSPATPPPAATPAPTTPTPPKQ